MVVLLLVAACGGEAADPPAAISTTSISTPSTSTPTSTSTVSAPETTAPADPCAAETLRPLDGFGEVVLRVTAPDGARQEHCTLLADTGETRQQGLMAQTDLRGYAGMVFRFDEPIESRFFMRDTLLPLSIAFYDADGRFVSDADMDPCPDEVDDCPTFGADAPYVHAIEVAQGDLGTFGLVEGSTISFP